MITLLLPLIAFIWLLIETNWLTIRLPYNTTFSDAPGIITHSDVVVTRFDLIGYQPPAQPNRKQFTLIPANTLTKVNYDFQDNVYRELWLNSFR